MPEGMIDLAELPSSWINTMPVECMKYARHLTARYHGIELFDLTEVELLNVMRDVCLCAKALKRVTLAVKINYEIHGNTEPHLHIHLYPRFVDDPFPGQAINYNQKSASIYVPGEYEDFVARMRKELIPNP
jgi:diadenosine tetraphosphate (Ap4A) HIT family hydrolase